MARVCRRWSRAIWAAFSAKRIGLQHWLSASWPTVVDGTAGVKSGGERCPWSPPANWPTIVRSQRRVVAPARNPAEERDRSPGPGVGRKGADRERHGAPGNTDKRLRARLTAHP